MKAPLHNSGRYAALGTRTTSAPAAESRLTRSAAIAPSPITRQRRPRTYRDTASAGRGDIMSYDRQTMKGRKRPFVENEVTTRKPRRKAEALVPAPETPEIVRVSDEEEPDDTEPT